MTWERSRMSVVEIKSRLLRILVKQSICFNVVEQNNILNCEFVKRNMVVKTQNPRKWAVVWEVLVES